MNRILYSTDEYDYNLQEVVIGDALSRFLLDKTPMQVRSLFRYAFESQYSSDVRRDLNALLAVKRPDGAPSMNYFAIRRGDSPMVSYTPYGKQLTVTPDGSWSRDGRQSMKPGRWIRALFNTQALQRFAITDDVLGQLTQGVNAYCTMQDALHIVKGDDIPRYYSSHTYSEDCGTHDDDDDGNTLWSSCMRHPSYGPNGFFRLYAESPNCSMLVALRDGKVSGRALVWSNVDATLASCEPHEAQGYPKSERITDRITFMDRVYAIEPMVVEAFIAYAEEHGWYYKVKQSMDSWHAVKSPNGMSMTARMHVASGITVSNTALVGVTYPYMDTFPWIDADGTLKNYDSYTTKGTMWSTSGMILSAGQPSYGMRSNTTDPFNEIGMVIMVDTPLHGMVPQDSVIPCNVCGRDGNAMLLRVVQVAHNTDARQCEECVETLLRDGTLRDLGGGYVVHHSLVVDALLPDGVTIRPTHTDDVVYSDYHGTHVLRGTARNVYPHGWVYWHVLCESITGRNIRSWDTTNLVESGWHNAWLQREHARWVDATRDWVHVDSLYDYLRNHKEARWAVRMHAAVQRDALHYIGPITPRKITYASVERVARAYYTHDRVYLMGRMCAGVYYSYGLTVEDLPSHYITDCDFVSGYVTEWGRLIALGAPHANATNPLTTDNAG